MISVIACTNRPRFVLNIIKNFRRQSIKDKELIIILNTLEIAALSVEQLVGKYKIKYKIYQFPDHISLGECLNFGIETASFDIVAKWDDDDYYGPHYLKEAYNALTSQNADIVGKSTFYICFEKTSELRLYNPNSENQWIINPGKELYKKRYFFSGATLVFHKKVYSTVPFPPVNQGEDYLFQQQCFLHQFKMLSLSNRYYVYVRYGSPYHHSSDSKESILRKRSKFVSPANPMELNRFVN
ncbi:glycosyltransferase family 2 protein [Neobacillus dielmonensis]|uniref:glycosyltransferase family 2 protein n=1 Tax=Neobacillus dielmonensis TaxID=1347369 RepID=UPI0005AA19DE|nr:glycosyltransferase [Neobacillus dielmonensis]